MAVEDDASIVGWHVETWRAGRSLTPEEAVERVVGELSPGQLVIAAELL